MKYAVTGHTQGIGKAIYEKLLPDCIGFSRSNGYDITNKKDRQRIIEESLECDIFINNATDGKGHNMGQTLLLIDLFYIWKDLDKKIISIGSRIAEYKEAIYEPKLLGYQAEKLILKEMSTKLAEVKVKCEIDYKWFGYVGTEGILKKYPHFKYPDDYISIDEAVSLILN
jgi:hypothetical protein